LLEKESKFQFDVRMPMIRLQVRCPPPPHVAEPRSGSVVLDMHNVCISPGAPAKSSKSMARFAEEGEGAKDPNLGIDALLSVEFRRLILAYAPTGQNKAIAILSAGPFSTPRIADISSPNFGASPSSAETISLNPPLIPSIVIGKSTRTRSSSTTPALPGTILAVSVSCVHVNLAKPVLDGLQLWADDVSQLLERAFGEHPESQKGSRDTSIVGSNFFVKSRSGSDSETSDLESEDVSETIVKIMVSEGTFGILPKCPFHSVKSAFVRIILPRTTEPSGTTRPFYLTASDLDCLVELKPEGKVRGLVML
jgi:autophagy-related protein 2